MTDAIYILNTKALKEAGYEGSLNDLADNIADKGGVVSGSYEESGEPVMTVYGIEEEDLLILLEDGGVENAAEIIETSRVEESDETDFDEELDNAEDNQDELPDDDNDVDEDPTMIKDNIDDESEPDSDEEDEIIELEDDEIDEIENLHDEEEELHDQEEEIHDQEEEIDPDEEEIELHHQEEEIHDEEEERHEEIEDEYDDLEESKKVKRGTQNLSESVTRSIISQVRDAYILKRIQDRAEVVDNLLTECKKGVTINMNPWSNVVVNGTPIWKYRNLDIVDMIKESKNSYRELYKKYKSLNESHTRRKDIVQALKKQKKLLEILESEALFRNINKNTKLNEDIDTNDTALENNNDDTSNSSNEQTQEATLTSIVFKVKNADEFIKVLTDHGIPAEALKKGTTDDTTEDNTQNQENNEQNQETQPMDNGFGGGAPAPAPAPSSNPFESVTTRLTKNNKLNEAGNPFDEIANDGQDSASTGDPDQAGDIQGVDPLNADESQAAGEGEEVILTDTSYASQVQKVLEDVYGYPKDQFEEKIGGQLVDEDGSDETQDDNIFDDADGSDDGSEDDTIKDEDDEKVGNQESISPEDIFSDLPGGL